MIREEVRRDLAEADIVKGKLDVHKSSPDPDRKRFKSSCVNFAIQF